MSEGNPFARLAAAARGDLEAQRGFVLNALERFGATRIDHRNFDEAREEAGTLMERFGVLDAAVLIEALVFARMAAAQGDHRDNDRLLALLTLGAVLLPLEVSGDIAAEKIARASIRADNDPTGQHEALDLLVNYFTNEAPPKVAAKAHAYRHLIEASGAN